MSYLFLFTFLILNAKASDVYELEKIQITTNKKVSDFNVAKPETITSAKLEAEPSGQVASLISTVPGVISNQNGGPGGRVSYFIRGTESRHVSFTLDGLKLNDPSNTDRQFDSAFFSAPFLSQVEVHKGPQAVLYGSDALGGMIEMKTRKGENAPEMRVSLNGGSFGTINSSLSHDWKLADDKNRGTLTAYQFHSDGISRLNKKRFKASERDSSDITQLTSSSSHDWAYKIQTDLLFSYLQGKNELDGASDDNSNDESQNDQYIAQQKTTLELSKDTAISLRNGFNRHQRQLDTLAVGVEGYTGNLIQNEVLLGHKEGRMSLLTGLSSEHEEFTSKNIDRSFDLHSVFMQTVYRLSNFKLQAGARAEKHVRYGDFYTGSAGAAYLWGINRFFIQYSQGFKAPSLYQLYAPPLFGFNIGNTELVPEVNHAWEGGWSVSDKEFEGGVTLFQNRLSNLITFTTTQGYLNQSRFTAEGVELAAKYKLRSVHFFSNFTHQAFRHQEQVVLRRPLNSLVTGVAVFPTERSEVSLKNRWSSARKDFDQSGNVVKLNGYHAFDLGFKYLFTKLELGLQVINILDRQYEELYGYSVMPRSVFIHTGYVF
jgi:vitamin B12 transporter